MWMFGWRFLIVPLGVLVVNLGLWAYSEKGWAQEDPLQTEMAPVPDSPPNSPMVDEPGVDEPGALSPGDQVSEPMEEDLQEELQEELNDVPRGPTAAEEILAPLEEVGFTGDRLEGVGPQEYIVKEGDTLWDITHTYFTDSFLWPKVWKSNKAILDPDLIYPGNIILIPGEPGAPFLPPPGLSPVSAPAPPTPAGPRTAAPAEKGPSSEAPKRHRIEIVLPEVTSPQHFILDLSTLPNPGYMITKEDRKGKIVGARDGRELIGEGETAYLRASRGNRPVIGDQFTVYRVVRKVEHPKTGRTIGKLLRILGTVEVINSKPKEKTLTAKVTDSLDYMRSGDLLMPIVSRETATSVSYSTTPETPLDGFILDVKENRMAQAEHDLVFLDRGRQHGLKIGNRLTIVRDGLRTPIISPGRGVKLPSRTIGQLQVISVQDITSTALIIKSTEVILRGDRFETPPKP